MGPGWRMSRGSGVGWAAAVRVGVGSALSLCARACSWVLRGSLFSGVAGYVGSAWVVGRMWDLGLGLDAVGACAWPCVRDGFSFGLRTLRELVCACGCGVGRLFCLLVCVVMCGGACLFDFVLVTNIEVFGAMLAGVLCEPVPCGIHGLNSHSVHYHCLYRLYCLAGATARPRHHGEVLHYKSSEFGEFMD